jgi:hypothetical protein
LGNDEPIKALKKRKGKVYNTPEARTVIRGAKDILTIKSDFERDAKTWYKFDMLSQDLFDCGERIYSTELAYRDLIKEHAYLKKAHAKLLDEVKEVKEWAGKEGNQKKR